MNRYFTALIVIIVLMIALAQTSRAAGFYSKPEFRGRVIDAETKEPIEGAVAVVLYDKRPLIGGPGGANSYAFHAEETLTNSKGEFRIPKYSSALLFTEDAGIRFIFYKPGYMADYGPIKIKPILLEKYFSAGKAGEVLEIEEGTFEQGSYVRWKGPVGIAELKKARTREDRIKTRPSKGGFEAQNLPIFFKTIEDEYQHLYNER